MDERESARRPVARKLLATPVALGPILLSVLAFALPRGQVASASAAGEPPRLQQMEVRAAVLSQGFGRVESFYQSRVAPIERVLSGYHEDAAFVRSVALALVAEGDRAEIDPRILVSVLLVENPWLDPDVRSSVGAVGLMQVMPFHAGRWGCGSADLEDVRVNVCHGARIFAAYLEQHQGDLDRALLAYNGCVKGANTPDCHLYPSHVYSRAGRMMMQGWLDLP